MANKWEPLTIEQTRKLKILNDPMANLLLINGWRRNELRQAICNYIPGTQKVYFKPKKAQKDKLQLLTDREVALLTELYHTTGIANKSKSAGNQQIHRHFKTLEKKLGFHIHPHMLRATMATEMGELGVPESVIQATMHHKNRKNTNDYMQVRPQQVKIAKETNGELATFDGMTIHEWRKLLVEKNRQIARLERKIADILAQQFKEGK